MGTRDFQLIALASNGCESHVTDDQNPPITPEVREEIQFTQHAIHEQYWAELRAIGQPIVVTITTLMGIKTHPAKPPVPFKLCEILSRYAIALFDAEKERYPPSPASAEWRSALANVIEHMVMENVARVERGGFVSLTIHATYDQMRASVATRLQRHVRYLQTSCDSIAPTNTVKELIDAYCEQQHCSLEGLADIANVDRRQVFKIRNGQHVHKKARESVAKVLGVDSMAILPKK